MSRDLVAELLSIKIIVILINLVIVITVSFVVDPVLTTKVFVVCAALIVAWFAIYIATVAIMNACYRKNASDADGELNSM